MKKLMTALLLICNVAIADNVTLAWDANAPADNVTSYIVYEKSGAILTKVGETAATTITLTNQTSAAHVWVVSAKNIRGEGLPSLPVGLPALPGQTGNVRVTVQVTVQGP